MPTALAKSDPLSFFKIGAVVAASKFPIPLVATQIGVRIRGGLAIVRTERTFRNAEASSIEATITFPVPVHATLSRLEARIGERLLEAKAQRRATARETYEEALDSGKTAVLHEEVIRGVHMLSVGHVPAGEEIVVTTVWSLPLSRSEAGARLRIPTTIGDIYGRSPLSDSDDLEHADVVHEAELEISCDSGTPHLVGAALADGKARLRLDAPIDIVVTGWTPKAITGRSADGRAVVLDVTPAADGEAPISARLLIDHSGSMGERVTGAGGESMSKHEAVRAGLRAAAGQMRARDSIELCEFANTPRRVAPRHEAGFLAAVEALSAPTGGTELGIALSFAAEGDVRDVLLVTDGKSHALDVQALARTGKRFTVVLIGEDALEANIGHLAALTGGQLFVAGGADVTEALRLAFAALRTPKPDAAPIMGTPTEAHQCIAGMNVRATWRKATRSDRTDEDARAVGAAAAALALPLLSEEDASALAESHGIVCHLTSLVLVDTAGNVQESIPAQRKIPLMTPRTVHTVALCDAAAEMPIRAAYAVPLAVADAGIVTGGWSGCLPESSSWGDIGTFLRSLPQARKPDIVMPELGMADLKRVLGRIDWSLAPERLRRGDLEGLPAEVANEIRRATLLPAIATLAKSLGKDVRAVVIALLARAERHDRSAARVARVVLAGADPALLKAALSAAGLPTR